MDPMVNGPKAQCCETEKAPAYFPQPEDALPRKPEGPMKAIGPWATGRVTYSPTDGMTGLRPVVDRYSITRYSAVQWRAHNRKFFDQAKAMIDRAQYENRYSFELNFKKVQFEKLIKISPIFRSLANKSKLINAQIYKETDGHQLENRDRLSQRASVVYGWKTELERSLAEMVEEIELLEGERRRVKQSLSVLVIPESISGDLLQLRSCRLEPDLVRDRVEDELVKVSFLQFDIVRRTIFFKSFSHVAQKN